MAVKFSQFVVETDKANVNYLVGWDGTENVQITPADLFSGTPSGTGAAGQIAFFDSASTLAGDNDFYWNNTNTRLGIKTTSPEARIHIRSNDNQTGRMLLVDQDGAGDATLAFRLSGTIEYAIGIDNSDSDSFKISNGNSVGSTDYLTITSSGNVGIGTTSPSAKLEVDGSLTATGISQLGSGGNNVYLTSSSAGNVGIGTSSPSQKLHVFGTTRISGTNNLDIFSDNTAATFNLASNARGFLFKNLNGDLVTISSSGNVGIGTSSPQTKFHVSGGQALFASDTAANPILPFGIEVYRNTGGNSNVLIHQDDGNHEAVLHMRCGGNDTKIKTGPNTWALKIDTENITDAIALMSGSGNLGIGTTSPSEKLDVVGNINLDGTSTRVFFGGNNTFVGENSNSNELILRGGGSTTAESVYIDTSGNVGIGTSNPTNKLHIQSSDNAATANLVYLENIGSGGSEGVSIKFNPMFNAESMIASNREGAVANACNLTFHTYNNTINEAMRITSAGNVGIGTTSPSNVLHVEGDPNSAGVLARFKGSSSLGSLIRFDRGSSFDWKIGVGSGSATTGIPSSYYGIAESSVGPRLVIAHTTGNVGIGTNSPASKLEVDGGDIEVDDSASGLILRSPDGTRYRVTVANGGTLSVSAV